MNKHAIPYLDTESKAKLIAEVKFTNFSALSASFSVCNDESSASLTFSATITPPPFQGPPGENPCLFGFPRFVGSQANLGNAGTQPNPEGRETATPAKLNEKDVDSFAGVFLPDHDVHSLLMFLGRVGLDLWNTENHDIAEQAAAWERKIGHE